MTVVNIDLAEPDGKPLTGCLDFKPTLRFAHDSQLRLPTPVQVVLQAGLASPDLPPSEPGWVWQVVERVKGGHRRFVQIPATGPVAYADLPDIDPATAEPAAAPLPMWAESLVVAASDIDNLQQTAAGLATTVATKADAATVATLTNTVATKAGQSGVDALAVAVATKAAQSALDGLAVTVASKADASALPGKADKATVDTLATAVAAKAPQSAVDALTTTVGTKADQSIVTALAAAKADASTVTALATTVSTKADASTVATLTTTVGAKADKTTVDGLAATVAALHTVAFDTDGTPYVIR